MILTLKTDQPEAAISLIDNSGSTLEQKTWNAGRELSDDLLAQIEALLAKQGKALGDITGVIVFKGPGSFTGLRIGHTIANTLAYSNDVPVVATSEAAWIELGLKRLNNGESDQIAMPEYGGEANITKPRK